MECRDNHHVWKAGWLYRRTKVLHRWKKTYFELDKQGVLRYSSHPGSLKSEAGGGGGKKNIHVGSHVSRVAPVDAARGVDCPAGVDFGDCCFLEMVFLSGRSMMLCGQPVEEVRSWQGALEGALRVSLNGGLSGVPSVVHVSRAPLGQKRRVISPSPMAMHEGPVSLTNGRREVPAAMLPDTGHPQRPRSDIFCTT